MKHHRNTHALVAMVTRDIKEGIPNSASPIKHAGSKIATSPVATSPELPIWRYIPNHQ
jgi:hypothetical protein